MKVVATYSKPEEAYLAASLLESSGIKVEVRDDNTVNMYWLYSNAIGGVKVVVSDDAYATAREILELPPLERGLLRCPHCGSYHVHQRELSGLSALGMLIVGFIFPLKSHRADCLDCGQSFDVTDAERCAREAPESDTKS